MHKNFKQICNW